MVFSTITKKGGTASDTRYSRDSPLTTKHKITISQLAEQAGVSVPTVSKVLNGRPGVSESTQKQIRDLIRQTGYVPRSSPHNLQNRTVELLISHPHSAWADEILVGVLEGLKDSGYSPIVSARPPVEWDFGPWFQEALSHGSRGALICLTHVSQANIQQMLDNGMKTIMIDPTGIVPPNTPVIGSGDYQGCKDATRHLIELGHRRIAFLKGPDEWQTCRARYDGFRSVMEEHHLTIDPELITGSAHFFDDGYECGNRLFSLHRRPTAVFASSDMQAAGLYRSAREHGIRIPEDVSVVGFDDLPYIEFLHPQLTTVHHAIKDMAKLGAQTLVDIINHKPTLTHVDLAAPLVIRESTCPPAQ